MQHIGNKCTACFACQQICAQHAIKMSPTDEGFFKPQIDNDKCIDCGMCEKVCPHLHPDDLKHHSPMYYAVQIKDSEILSKSSSGGAFSLLAQYILEKKGIIYGAAWNTGMKLRHIRVTCEEELDQLRGSKYLSSNLDGIFKLVKADLKNDNWVLFVGSPCQVAGLKGFLRKEYERLVTADFVCHGTPSQKIFDLFLNHLIAEQKATCVLDYSFRDKNINGWSCSSSSSSVKRGSREKYIIYDKNMSAYYQAFIKGHLFREECYKCSFACTDRVGDITLADFWGINNVMPEFPKTKDGVSLLLVNSNKGRAIWEKINNKAVWMSSNEETVKLTNNNNLFRPSSRPVERDSAYKDAFNDYYKFRNLYLKGVKKRTFYKQYYLRKLKKYTIVKQLYSLLGKPL